MRPFLLILLLHLVSFADAETVLSMSAPRATAGGSIELVMTITNSDASTLTMELPEHFHFRLETPTAVSTLSTRWRNVAMAVSIDARCSCSVTSSWVATQPPPGIGARNTLIKRPSVSLSTRLETVSSECLFSVANRSCFDVARRPLEIRCRMMASCEAPGAASSGGRA